MTKQNRLLIKMGRFIFITALISFACGQETRKDYPDTQDRMIVFERTLLLLSEKLSSSETLLQSYEGKVYH